MAAKPKTKTPAEPAVVETGTVTVRVLYHSLAEEGRVYTRGDTFATTAERAAALGEMVEIASQ
jgi:hypothetical protein